ncbi:MAG: cyclic nucleotide-binding domain-containing protein [Chloroflexi bacterium]|nr:cyclic nucleotide-binding domain-containing protein [Chloroflexota bacterium]
MSDIGWLRRIHLFRDVPASLLQDFLDRATLREAEPGEELIVQADPGSPFVILRKGRAEAYVRLSADQVLPLGILQAQDHAGLEAALKGYRSPMTVRALRPVEYYSIKRADLVAWLAKVPEEVRRRFYFIAEAQRKARVQRPDWLQNTEWAIVYARRHWIVAAWRGGWLLAALFLSIVWWAIHTWYWPSRLFLFLIPVTLLLGLFLTAWGVIEWLNDYYVVTPLRVARVDRIFPIHDSRFEVPVTMINAVGVETEFLGRLLGYGDVLVRTWAEPILRLVQAPEPHAISGVIEELMDRERETWSKAEQRAMQEHLREVLGLPTQTDEEELAPEAPAISSLQAVRPTSWWGYVWAFIRSYLQPRIVTGDIITYRKHPIFLLRRAAPALIPLFLIWFYALLWLQFGWPWPTEGFLLSFLVLVTLFSLLYTMYQIWDWANDLYQLTPTQIVDLKQVPFGEAERKVAPLEKVVGADFERPSFWARIFNYGDVRIQMGGEEPLIFERVWQPDQVQQDLFTRMEERRRREEEARWLQDRERFVEWLAAYHKLRGEVAAAEERPSRPAKAPRPRRPSSPEPRLGEEDWEFGYPSEGGDEDLWLPRRPPRHDDDEGFGEDGGL